jgi:hypothetical protein
MELLTSLALLACPVGMGLMMWFMMRGMNGESRSRPVQPAASLESLRDERQRIDAELQRRETDASFAVERSS